MPHVTIFLMSRNAQLHPMSNVHAIAHLARKVLKLTTSCSQSVHMMLFVRINALHNFHCIKSGFECRSCTPNYKHLDNLSTLNIRRTTKFTRSTLSNSTSGKRPHSTSAFHTLLKDCITDGVIKAGRSDRKH